MKKILSLLIVLAIVIAPSVFAGEIKTADASIDTNGKITVKGTTESSVVAVAVAIHAEDGTFIKVVTGSVNDDNTYEVTADMEAKKYILKVADYHGGNFIEKEVDPSTATNADEVKPVNNAPTFDPILIIAAIGVASLVGITYSAYSLRKNKQK